MDIGFQLLNLYYFFMYLTMSQFLKFIGTNYFRFDISFFNIELTDKKQYDTIQYTVLYSTIRYLSKYRKIKTYRIVMIDFDIIKTVVIVLIRTTKLFIDLKCFFTMFFENRLSFT